MLPRQARDRGIGKLKKGHCLCKQGVVPPALVPKVVASLVDELTNPAGVAKAHIDTGANTCSWGVFPTFDVQNDHFHQDRLGTNMGKTQRRTPHLT